MNLILGPISITASAYILYYLPVYILTSNTSLRRKSEKYDLDPKKLISKSVD